MAELWYSITEINGDNAEWTMHRSRDAAIRANRRKAQQYTDGVYGATDRYSVPSSDSTVITVLQGQTDTLIVRLYIAQVGGN